MPRQPRIDYAGAWHHVTNRGRNKQLVFLDEGDFLFFLDLFSIATTIYKIEVHSYCLMSNHYHALVRSMTGELSAAMQFIAGRYTLEFNQKHGLDGALFKGRFFSKVIVDEGHLMEAVRYIPNNPVKAGIVKQPEQYRWSSYRYTLGLQPPPTFLDVTTLGNWLFGRDLATFDAFVRRSDTERSRLFEQAIEANDSEPLLSTAVERIQAATEQFHDMAVPSPARAASKTALVDYVIQAFELPLHAIMCPISPRTELARLLLLTLLYRHGVAPLDDLGDAFGFRSRSSAHAAIRRFEQSVRSDTALAGLLNRGLLLIPSAA